MKRNISEIIEQKSKQNSFIDQTDNEANQVRSIKDSLSIDLKLIQNKSMKWIDKKIKNIIS